MHFGLARPRKAAEVLETAGTSCARELVGFVSKEGVGINSTRVEGT